MNKSYIRPLFWQHGEPEAVLKEEIHQMFQNGIDSFIVESRPHPDYLSYGWWRDMDIIIAEAKRLGMKVWIFDDSAFPSGYGAGKLKSLYPEAGKKYVREAHIDAIGPLDGSSFRIRDWLNQDEKIIRVTAARRKGNYEDLEDGSLMDITSLEEDGILYWDVPEGAWRIFLFILTGNGGEEWTKDYVNPIDRDCVDRFIQIIYEEHYQRYKEEFGTVIQGFFSDELRFGNAASYHMHPGDWTEYGGTAPAVFPWSRRLPELLEEECGEDIGKLLPYLWCGESGHAKDVRFAYQDQVSRLFGTEFIGRIGEWCRAHKVKLIGHVVEDNGAHARLGYGCGHFFRAMEGMDASGLDVVYQIWPEYTQGRHLTPFGYLDSYFYYWGLPKMASSLAHLDPKKKGITVCEIFGAYGWQEGLKLMKWLTDHVCVRGINRLIPHAFSPKEKDEDCPPHFYARGENPQWDYFHVWSDYANRLCTLLSEGQHIADVAVLYHAEAEWGGEYEPFETAVKALAEAQIDCDVVPADYLTQDRASVRDGKLTINEESYGVLIIPYAQALPETTVRELLRLAEDGLTVLIMRDYPERIYFKPDSRLLTKLRGQENIYIRTYEALPEYFRKGETAVKIEGNFPYLSVMKRKTSAGTLYFFVNKSKYKTVRTTFSVGETEKLLWYDAMENRLFRSCLPEKDGTKGEAGQAQRELILEPYQSLFAFCGQTEEKAGLLAGELFGVQEIYEDPAVLPEPCSETETLAGAFRIYIQNVPEGGRTQLGLSSLCNLAVPGLLPEYSGKICYETDFSIDMQEDEGKKKYYLDLGNVYETAEVFVNGSRAGIRICPPYRLDVTGLIHAGKNQLTVTVANTLAKERGNNVFDRAMPQEPTGLLGPVRIIKA